MSLELKGTALTYTRGHSEPRADSYDFYWIEGDASRDDILENGNVIEDSSPMGIVTVSADAGIFSALVAANLEGYKTAYSDIIQIAPEQISFTAAPVLTITANNNSLVCSWTDSNPAAANYDLYWLQGDVTDVKAIKEGTKIEKGAAKNHTITGLTNGTAYSVVVTAGRTNYISRDSLPKTAVPSIPTFNRAPGLSLTPGHQSIFCMWPPTDPWSSNYDIYYRQGIYTNPNDVKAGTKVTRTEAQSVYGYMIEGLTNGAVYSVIVTANRNMYISADSPVRTAAPSASLAKSKRGVGYGFGTDAGGNAQQDMALLAPGISWFYNWANTPSSSLENIAVQNDVLFIPMTWNADYNVNNIKNYLLRHPEVEYILAYNEPMFTNEANMTPAQAAANWPTLKKLASDCNLKIISPALNYGQMMGPKEWFEQFIAQPNVSLSDMHAIALHCYMNYPTANKNYAVELFAEFGLPIWMTEFCAWNSPSNIPNVAWQEKFMSEVVIYYEQDPRVEKYAWFIPRSSWAGINNTGLPYHALFGGSSLNALGLIFINMSYCDKSVWVPSGEAIKAAQFTANHLVEWTVKDGWPGNEYGSFPDTGSSVHFRPTTDTGGQVLDIYNFTNNNWVEYQVDLASEKNYTLSIRYQTTSSSNIDVFVDNMNLRAANTVLNSSAWTTASVDLGSLSGGKHTIRLKVTNAGGNCAVNWLKVE